MNNPTPSLRYLIICIT